MRGLDEIQKINEFPHADHHEESFGTKHVVGSDFDRRNPASLAALRALGNGDPDQRRLSDDLAEAGGHRIRLSGDEILEAILGGRPKAHAVTDDQVAEDFLRKLQGLPTRREEKRAEALLGLLLLDALAAKDTKIDASKLDGRETGDETGGIKPTDGDETVGVKAGPLSPFEAFWSKRQTLNYGQAKRLFSGGETPIGAITFIGKEWDGIRAVPAKPVEYLGGQRPIYHGEFRIENSDGSLTWFKVLSTTNGEPLSYPIPEAALTAARDRKTGKS
jgi:hypothetical protein